MDEITQEDWGEILTAEWSRPFISLSGAVWWIATGGEARDCEDDELENASRRLIEAARNGEIAVFGVDADDDHNKPVPAERLPIRAMSFTGDAGDEDLLFGGPKAEQRPAVVFWMSGLQNDWQDEGGDNIATISKTLWRRLSVRKADLCAKWPRSNLSAALLMLGVDGREAATSPVIETPRPAKKPNKDEIIAAWLTDRYPTRPSMTNVELEELFRKDSQTIGSFSSRTFSKAIAKAYAK